VDELSFRCGQMSVRREAANMLPIIAGIRQCSAVDEGEGNSVGSKVETEDALRPLWRRKVKMLVSEPIA
jgi:hypothetical protein